MKILWYRFLDWFESFIRKKSKEIRQRRKWGPDWKDKTRPGRRFTRVQFVESVRADYDGGYLIRPEPGWEWTCPNCREYSIITESMMPNIIAAWAADAKRQTDLAAAKGVKYQIGQKPTAATAGCTNCRYRPGDPE